MKGGDEMNTTAEFGSQLGSNTPGSDDAIRLRTLSRPSRGGPDGVEAVSEDPSDIPILIQKLNRALAKLPPGGVPLEDEAELPPDYHEG